MIYVNEFSSWNLLGTNHLTWKGGGYGFFYKNILIPNVAEQNIVILVEDNKKKSDSELLSYNLMLNSGKKINILTLVLSEKKIWTKQKKHNPLIQV